MRVRILIICTYLIGIRITSLIGMINALDWYYSGTRIVILPYVFMS